MFRGRITVVSVLLVCMTFSLDIRETMAQDRKQPLFSEGANQRSYNGPSSIVRGCVPVLGQTNQHTLIQEAMLMGNPAERFRLLRECLRDDVTDLMIAAKVGDIKTVKQLLKSKVNVNAATRTGWTGLMEALSNNHIEIAEMLIQAGADVNARSNTGISPLYLGAAESKMIVNNLIKRGADVDTVGYAGQTPLMVACRNKRIQIAAVLLKRGADVTKRDDLGRTALIHAAFGPDDESGGNAKCVGLLLDYKAEPNVRASDGQTALMGTAFYGDLRGTRMLLERGADINCRSKEGLSALGQAERAGHYKIVRLLLDSGATR